MATSTINQQFRASIGNDTSIPAASIPNGTFVTVATFTPSDRGIYILEADIVFAAGTGNRILLMDTFETNNNNAANSVLAEGRATLQKIRLFRLTTADTVYIRVYQNSGAAMSVSGNYRWLMVGN